MPTLTLGERIQQARQEAGLNQRQLAEVAGIGQGHLSEIERGLKRPSIATLKRLREALSLREDKWTTWIDAA